MNNSIISICWFLACSLVAVDFVTAEVTPDTLPDRPSLEALQRAIQSDDPKTQLASLEAMTLQLRADRSSFGADREKILEELRKIFETAGPLPITDAELESDDEKRIAFGVKMQSLVVAWLLDEETGRTLLEKLKQSDNHLLREQAARIEETDGRRLSIVMDALLEDQVVEVIHLLFTSTDAEVRATCANSIGTVAATSNDRFAERLFLIAKEQFAKETSGVVKYALLENMREIGLERIVVREFLSSVASSPTEDRGLRERARLLLVR